MSEKLIEVRDVSAKDYEINHSRDAMIHLHDTCRAYFMKKRSNKIQIHNHLRDKLLPKLMSGEIRVKESEKFAETSS